MKSSTFKQHLETLGVSKQFEDNVSAQLGLSLDKYIKVGGIIGNYGVLFGGAFRWNDSPEGHSFWAKKDEEFLKLLEKDEE